MKCAAVLLLTAILQAGESIAPVQSCCRGAGFRACISKDLPFALPWIHGKGMCPAAREQVEAAGPWLLIGAFVQCLLLEEVNLLG